MNITILDNYTLIILSSIGCMWATFKMIYALYVKIKLDKNIEQWFKFKFLVKLEKSVTKNFCLLMNVFKILSCYYYVFLCGSDDFVSYNEFEDKKHVDKTYPLKRTIQF